MPDTANLTVEVHDLNDRLTLATEQMATAVIVMQEMTASYNAYKSFQQRVIRALAILAIVTTVIASIAGWTAVQVRSDQATEAIERCGRNQQLRSDVHAGMDAVLDEINEALPNSQTEEIVRRAKLAVREKIPLLDCDGRTLR